MPSPMRWTAPPVAIRYMDWKGIRWDGYSRAMDLSDSRSISIERYVDLDYAIAQFPDHAENLRSAATNYVDPAFELTQDDHLLPQAFHGTRSLQFGLASTGMLGRRDRHRVRLIETEYRRVMAQKRIRDMAGHYPELNGMVFDPQSDLHQEAIARQRVTLEDRPIERVWISIWSPGLLLLDMPSPYRHNKFSLSPIWCYRRHRDGMPYGVIRGLRDAQEAYNKRKSKALYALSTNRIMYEEDAFVEGDEDDMLDQAALPNGHVRLRKGALQGGKIRIDGNAEVAAGHVSLMEQDAQHIFEAGGTTRENLGLDSDAKSGKAILAKQQQGAVATAEMFDNLRLHVQLSGQKTLSLVEQFMSAPMQLRITGEDGQPDWVAVNQPAFDPMTGEVIFENDLTESAADFIVDQQDYRETVRMAMAEMLMETIRGVPPEIGLQLLDIAIEMTDLPNRDKLVARIRQITGAGQPPAEPDPGQQEQEQQAQDIERELAQRERLARIAKEEAAAEKLRAGATRDTNAARSDMVKAKQLAFDLAALLGQNIQLAPAADRLAEFPAQAGNTPEIP